MVVSMRAVEIEDYRHAIQKVKWSGPIVKPC